MAVIGSQDKRKRAAQAPRGQHTHLRRTKADTRPIAPSPFLISNSRRKEQGYDGKSVYRAASTGKPSKPHKSGWRDDRRRRFGINRNNYTASTVPGCVTSSTLSMAQYCLMIQMMGRARSLTVGRRLPKVWPAASTPVLQQDLHISASTDSLRKTDRMVAGRSRLNACWLSSSARSSRV